WPTARHSRTDPLGLAPHAGQSTADGETARFERRRRSGSILSPPSDARRSRTKRRQPLTATSLRGDSYMELLEALSAQAAFINSEVIPWVLRLVMIGMGLSLTVGDFKRVIVFPKAAGIGLVAQLLGLPLAAFGLAWLFGAPPAIAIGLVILAACPSGVTSNAYTFAARADVP